jgi:hypothetical protein
MFFVVEINVNDFFFYLTLESSDLSFLSHIKN